MAGDLNIFKEVIKQEAEAWASHKGRGASLDSSLLEAQAKAVAELFERLYGGDSGVLAVLEAPTGSGKTEVFTALYFAQWRLKRWYAGRLFVAEPVHALLRQMKERVSLYGKLFGVAVGEDHGEVARPTYLYAAPAALTTVDSYVYGYLAKRVDRWVEGGAVTGRFTMPVGLMMNALTVFDEAHLIQDELYIGPRIISRVLCHLVDAGAPVVVSTATLPTALLKEFERHCGGKILRYALPGKARRVTIDTINKALSPDDVECEGSTLVVVNTVRRAREMYKALKERCRRQRVYVVHSLMRRRDREGVIDEISKLERERGLDEVILVGTQAVEVGIDFSFRRLYTELAPIDALVQRIGRVGRGGEEATAYVYSEVDTPPYQENVMRLTKGVLVTISKIDLGDVDSVREVVDRVYTDRVVEELSKRGDELYLDAVDYLANLHLFALPPEQELNIRPSFYVDLYLIDAGATKPSPAGDKEAEVKVPSAELEGGRIRISENVHRRGRLEQVLKVVEGCKFYRVKSLEEDDAVLSQVGGGADNALGVALWSGHLVAVCSDLASVYDEAGLAVEAVDAKKTDRSAKAAKKRGRGKR